MVRQFEAINSNFERGTSHELPRVRCRLTATLEPRSWLDRPAREGDCMQKFGRANATVTPSQFDKAYAAGLFDGEGNVCIGANKNVPEAKGIIYNMRIGAAQNEPEVLFWLRDRWGGSVNPTRRKTAAHNITHTWACFARKAAVFLENVLPFLQIKRERALLALKFQRIIFQPGRGGHSEEHRLILASLKIEMNNLNTHKSTRLLT